jgi:hypothetical protein
MSPRRLWWLLPVALAALVARPGRSGAPARPSPLKAPPAAPARAAAGVEAMGEIEAPPPPFSDGVFPCSDCHDRDAEVDRTRRELSQHDEIKLEHDAEHRWCLDCHDEKERDKLRLASGDKIDFAESYKLCGQCHGDKYRDWRAGVHGRRTGQWNGKKTYLLCVHCHNPHSPQFKPLQPSPPPVRPERLLKESHVGT